MKHPRLRIDFSKYKDADLEVKAQAIITAMTGNIHFPAPVPTLASVQDQVDNYTLALSKAQTGNRIEGAKKRYQRCELIKMLVALSDYIACKAGNSETVLTSSGFDLVKLNTGSRVIGMPENFLILHGINEGEMISKVRSVTGARTYIHEYTPDPVTSTSQWIQQMTTLRRCTFADLEPGKRYWFRVAAIGSQQQVVYTHPQLRMAV